MTLDEAIMCEEEFVEGHEMIKRIKAVTLEECKCAEEHRRLAEWLKELKQYKEYEMGKQALQGFLEGIGAPANDCVSRISVQEEITKSIELKENPHQLWKRIQTLSPVQPEQREGWWIDDKCSVCGKGVEDLISSREWYQNENPKYCPFCGIKIEEVEE